jgi:hypothetical protein
MAAPLGWMELRDMEFQAILAWAFEVQEVQKQFKRFGPLESKVKSAGEQLQSQKQN